MYDKPCPTKIHNQSIFDVFYNLKAGDWPGEFIIKFVEFKDNCFTL